VLVIAATERELACAGPAVQAVVCGVGPVEAAAATAACLAKARPSAVLHFGLAGASAFEGPELVLGSEAVYCDTDSPLVPGRARPAPDLLERAKAALGDARTAPIGTSARLGGTGGCATACDVEAMEGFAVLRACELAGVPALELRATSNAIGEEDRGRWQIEGALALLKTALPRLLEALDA
jgi:nucleoside phosphorylase